MTWEQIQHKTNTEKKVFKSSRKEFNLLGGSRAQTSDLQSELGNLLQRILNSRGAQREKMFQARMKTRGKEVYPCY